MPMAALTCTVICVCFHLVDASTCFQPLLCKVTLYQFFDKTGKLNFTGKHDLDKVSSLNYPATDITSSSFKKHQLLSTNPLPTLKKNPNIKHPH